MILALLFRTLFIILSILLIAVAFIVFNKAYHLKGQRFVFGILLSFGLAYFFETLRYMVPVEYSYFIQYWLVGSLMIGALCLTAHYIFIIIKRHSLLKIRYVPQIFYLFLFVYLGILGPLDLVSTRPFEEINGWHIQASMGYRGFIYVLFPLAFIQIIYLLFNGYKYAPSTKRKNLYKNYMYGAVLSTILAIVAAIMNLNSVLPGETYLMLSFIPFLLVLAKENYNFSPGFTKHYNRMIEMSPTAILVLDRDFCIVEISERAHEWFPGNKHDPIHESLGSDENMMEMMKFLTLLQMQNDITDYQMPLHFEEKMEYFSIMASIFEVEDQYYYYMLVRNVTKEHEQEELIFHLAYHDVLTDIFNRTYFTEHMQEVYENNKGGALVLSDLNFFKRINDTYGHQIGDEVLIHTAMIFNDLLKEPNIVARLGGDEFIFYLPETDEEKAHQLIEHVRYQFTVRPFVKDQLVIEVIPSFGLTMIEDHHTYEITYHLADVAMYKDKKKVKEERAQQEKESAQLVPATELV